MQTSSVGSARHEATDAVGPRGRWAIAALLGAGVLINYLDRLNLTVAGPALHAEFGIGTVAYSFLLSAYSWTYALMQLPSGMLLDRFGVKKVGVAGTSLWAAACFSTAAATRTIWLFA